MRKLGIILMALVISTILLETSHARSRMTQPRINNAHTQAIQQHNRLLNSAQARRHREINQMQRYQSRQIRINAANNKEIKNRQMQRLREKRARQHQYTGW